MTEEMYEEDQSWFSHTRTSLTENKQHVENFVWD